MRELSHWSPYINLCPEGSILKLKKQDLGINPYAANNGYRDQSLNGIGGPRVTLQEESKVLGISGSLDGSVRLWCRSQHRALVTISPHNAPVTAIIIDKPLDVKVDSKEFIVTSASYLRVGWSGSTCSQPPGTALSGEWGWWLPGREQGRGFSSSGNVSPAKLYFY